MPIYGTVTFINNSVNLGEVDTAIFKDTSINDGEVTRGTFDDNSVNYGHIIEEGIFNDVSVNDGSSEGDVVLNDNAVDSNTPDEPAALASIDQTMEVDELPPTLGSDDMFPPIYPDYTGGDSYAVPDDFFTYRQNVDPIVSIPLPTSEEVINANPTYWAENLPTFVKESCDVAAALTNSTHYELSALCISSDYFFNDGSAKRNDQPISNLYDYVIDKSIDDFDASEAQMIDFFDIKKLDKRQIFYNAWTWKTPLTALDPNNPALENVFLWGFVDPISLDVISSLNLTNHSAVVTELKKTYSVTTKASLSIFFPSLAFYSQTDIDLVDIYCPGLKDCQIYSNTNFAYGGIVKYKIGDADEITINQYSPYYMEEPPPTNYTGEYSNIIICDNCDEQKEIAKVLSYQAEYPPTITTPDEYYVNYQEAGYANVVGANLDTPGGTNYSDVYAPDIYFALNNPVGSMSGSSMYPGVTTALLEAQNNSKPHTWAKSLKHYLLTPVKTTLNKDSKMTFTGRATIFGLNADGSFDPEDEGMGRWQIPNKSENYNTRNKKLHGISLNEKVIRALWGTYNINTMKLIDPHVLVEANGKKITVPLVDSGPALSTGNAIDLTYATVKYLFPNLSKNEKTPSWPSGVVKITPVQKGMMTTPEKIRDHLLEKYNSVPTKKLHNKGEQTTRRHAHKISAVMYAAAGLGGDREGTPKSSYLTTINKYLDRTSLDYHFKKSPWNLSQVITLVGFIPHPVAKSVSVVKGVVQVSARAVDMLLNRKKVQNLNITRRDLKSGIKRLWTGFINKGLEVVATSDYTRIIENVANTSIRIVTRRKAQWGLYQNINWLRKKGILPMDPNPDVGKPKEIKVTGFIGSSY